MDITTTVKEICNEYLKLSTRTLVRRIKNSIGYYIGNDRFFKELNDPVAVDRAYNDLVNYFKIVSPTMSAELIKEYGKNTTTRKACLEEVCRPRQAGAEYLAVYVPTEELSELPKRLQTVRVQYPVEPGMGISKVWAKHLEKTIDAIVINYARGEYSVEVDTSRPREITCLVDDEPISIMRVEKVVPPIRDFTLYIRRQILHRLIEKAFQQQTTNYLELATEFGLPTKGNQLGQVLSPILGDILTWCEQRKWPYLTSIVVRKSGQDKGLPGAGFWAIAGWSDLTREEKVAKVGTLQQEVFTYFTDFK